MGTETPVLALYNLYLREAISRLPQADLVLYFGDRIVSEPLREYLAAHRTEFILCSPYPLRQDAIENEFIYPTMKVWGDPGALAEDLVSALPARPPSSTRTRPGNLRVGRAATAGHPPGRACHWRAGGRTGHL